MKLTDEEIVIIEKLVAHNKEEVHKAYYCGKFALAFAHEGMVTTADLIMSTSNLIRWCIDNEFEHPYRAISQIDKKMGNSFIEKLCTYLFMRKGKIMTLQETTSMINQLNTQEYAKFESKLVELVGDNDLRAKIRYTLKCKHEDLPQLRKIYSEMMRICSDKILEELKIKPTRGNIQKSY